MRTTYSIGLDFGTLSARAMLVDNATGAAMAASVFEYPHGVIDSRLPESGVALPDNYALQHPQDYIEALEWLLGDVWRRGGVRPEDIVGIGVAFTGSTLIPVDRSIRPLCFDPRFAAQPHAWPMLWKHHGTQAQADRINRVAAERGEAFMRRYGGKSSAEWTIAKVLNVLEEAPEVYEAAHRFVDAGDWIVYLLTSSLTRNSCCAGYKVFWSGADGFPSRDFFAALHPRMEDVIDEKIGRQVNPIGSRAGSLSEAVARRTGLSPRTRVGVANLDAHTAVPATGICREGQLLMIMGTSLCQMVNSTRAVEIPGINGSIRDGILPGFYGVEAGQTAVGDIYDWFVSNCVPREYADEALQTGENLFQVLTRKAAALRPGASGLLALDWWNGNRSMLVDFNLTGLILGLTLTTRPEEIYRALIESTAFGSRVIAESLEQSCGMPFEIFACGGLSRKSPLVMQIFSDVLGREIRVSAAEQATALGAAIYGALAAGAADGGYDDIFEAIGRMSSGVDRVYSPNAENHAVYTRLFGEYRRLHDLFGREQPTMKTLLEIKRGL